MLLEILVFIASGVHTMSALKNSALHTPFFSEVSSQMTKDRTTPEICVLAFIPMLMTEFRRTGY